MASFIFGLTPEPRHAYVAPFAIFMNVVRKHLIGRTELIK